jgi:predicted amidophosphoribosyltransferase
MSQERPAPAGIGNCGRCPYLESGTSDICYRCARETIEPLAQNRCMTCDRELPGSGECGNPICNWTVPGRYFDWNYAIAMRSGVLRNAINAFKYSNRHGWRSIFGRVLVGFLDDEEETFEDFDLIVASPTYLVAGGQRRYDHTREVILAADKEAEGRWPFDDEDPAAIIKTAETERFVGRRWQQRRQIAEGALRNALSIPDTDRTVGKNILVYDDVFTDGFTLREVARCLKEEGGADRVCGVTLTRQPWAGRPEDYAA